MNVPSRACVIVPLVCSLLLPGCATRAPSVRPVSGETSRFDPIIRIYYPTGTASKRTGYMRHGSREANFYDMGPLHYGVTLEYVGSSSLGDVYAAEVSIEHGPNRRLHFTKGIIYAGIETIIYQDSSGCIVLGPEQSSPVEAIALRGIEEHADAARAGESPTADDATHLEEARQRIINHWHIIFSEPLVFTNAPGSDADLVDLQNAFNKLAPHFYTVK